MYGDGTVPSGGEVLYNGQFYVTAEGSAGHRVGDPLPTDVVELPGDQESPSGTFRPPTAEEIEKAREAWISTLPPGAQMDARRTNPLDPYKFLGQWKMQTRQQRGSYPSNFAPRATWRV